MESLLPFSAAARLNACILTVRKMINSLGNRSSAGLGPPIEHVTFVNPPSLNASLHAAHIMETPVLQPRNNCQVSCQKRSPHGKHGHHHHRQARNAAKVWSSADTLGQHGCGVLFTINSQCIIIDHNHISLLLVMV